MLKRGTGPNSLKKCTSCLEWKGALTFITYEKKVVDTCRKCREGK